MVLCAFLALATQGEDYQLSKTDKDVIEAAISAKERSSKKRIVFVYDTVDKDAIKELIRPVDMKSPCIGLLFRQNDSSVSLKGYRPSWAALSASQKEAKNWLQPKNPLFKEIALCTISLPSYCGRGYFASIYVNEQVKHGAHASGTTSILKFTSATGKWKLVGTIGRVVKK